MNGRNIGIDLLRAVAILTVIANHWGLSYLSKPSTAWWDEILRRIGGHGSYGVTLFFVLSGFLITRTTMKREPDLFCLSLRGFYLRRIARIQPLFLLAVAFGAAMLLIGDPSSHPFQDAYRNPKADFTGEFCVSLFSFTNNWERILRDGYWGLHWDVMWSLAIEEQFYLGFPLLILWAGSKRRLYAALASIVALGVATRIVGDAQHWGFLARNMNSLVCFETLALGALLALLGERLPHGKRVAPSCLGIGALLIGYGFYHGGIAPLIIGACLFVHGAAYADIFVDPSWASRGWQAIARIGQVSYGMYLIHATAIYFASPWLGQLPFLLGYAAIVAVAGAIAEISFRYYEAPMNNWLRGGRRLAAELA
ncbi:MAG TPA: acyltransferase [Stellaceae bacterium]|nr:acyltransferase [Stellaceae bacterium]